MNHVNRLLGDVEGFVNQVVDTLHRDGVEVSDLYLDHVCYRVETQEEYIHRQKSLSKIGRLLIEAIIGGRPISIYKLYNPLVIANREIEVIELPSPKHGTPYPAGLEHAEFVIADSFEDFMMNHPSVKFNMKGTSKPVNPEIRIEYDGFSVKFHHQSLEEVIRYEAQMEVPPL